MKLQYPLCKKDGTAYSTKELLTILASEKEGHYLLGSHDFWHGGVHFTDSAVSGSDAAITEFKNNLKDIPVKAIADGKIIAYRINNDYETLNLTPPEKEQDQQEGQEVQQQGQGQEESTSASTTSPSSFAPDTSAPTLSIPPAVSTAPNTGSGDAAKPEDAEQKDDPNKFKYSTSFCLIQHEYESSDAPIKMLPEDNSKKILRVTRANGLSRWGSKGSDKDEQNSFKVNDLLEVVTEETSTTSAGTTLYWAQGYELDKTTKERIKVDGAEKLYWMNTGQGKTQYQHVELLKQEPKTDWSDPETITVQAKDETGYSYKPDAKPQAIADCKTIAIPSGTKLTLVQPVSTSTANGLVYYQVRADKPLIATYRESNATGSTEKEVTYNAEDVIWYPITNQAGITRTGKDANNKDVPAAKPDPKTNKLTFYSLYMHLLPFEMYETKNPDEGKNYLRVTANALSLRDKASGKDSAKTGASAKKGDLFECIGDPVAAIDDKNSSLMFVNVYKVNEDGTRTDKQSYWVHSGNKNKPLSNVEASTPKNASKPKEQPLHWAHKADINCTVKHDVYALTGKQITDSAGKSADEQWGTLTKESTFSCSEHPELTDKNLIECTLTGGKIDSKLSDVPQIGGKSFYIHKNSFADAKVTYIECKVTPKTFNKTVPCDIRVKAGNILGYPGLYESPKDAKPEAGKDSKHLLHFEIFSNDKDRIDKFLDNGAKVTTGKKYLKINKNAKLSIGKSEPEETKAITGLPLSYFVNATTPTLKRNWIRPLSEVSTEEITPKEGDKEIWYKIPIAGLSDKEKETDREFGWIKKGESNEELNQHDLRKLDFIVIEETDENTNGDAFVDPYKVSVQGKEEVNKFFWHIYNKIDLLGDENRKGRGDRKLTPDEIQEAYKDEELSEVLQKIIGYHPTQWNKKMNAMEVVANRLTMAIDADAREDENNEDVKLLNPIRGQHEVIVKKFSGEETLRFLKQEQDRIDKLAFWEDVPELQSTPKVWHFHPVAFIEQIKSGVALQSVMPKKPENIRKIILHSTAAQAGVHQTVESIFAGQKSLGYTRIAYHYVIYLDGSLHFGRPENIMGAHAYWTNADSIGVVYVGGAKDRAGKIPLDTRTPEQKETQARIIEALMERYPLATVHGHIEFGGKSGATACPSFDVQTEFGHYNNGKTPDLRTTKNGDAPLNAFD